MEISQFIGQILDHNKNVVVLKLMNKAAKYRVIKKCDFTEINDLNNQVMNHKELDSCTEINKFGVKKPTNAGILSSISDPPWHVEEMKAVRNYSYCGKCR